MGNRKTVMEKESLGYIAENYRLENRNERGDKLIEFCSKHEL